MSNVATLKIHCGTPMVRTYAFSGKEYYCVKCGETDGIFGPASTAQETDELIRQLERNFKIFFEDSLACIPIGARFNVCELCKHEQHLDHASQEEIEASREAYKLLAGGILEEVTHATH